MRQGVTPDVKTRVTDEALVRRRRSQIIAAAVELFSHQGYYRTTIQDVARKAGVSTGLIYQYVNDKDEVLLLALASVLDLYRQEIPRALQGIADPLERWCTAFRAYCRVVGEHREATVLAYRSTKSLRRDRRQIIKDAETETNALIGDCVRDCIAAGLFRAVAVDVATYQMVTFAHGWALKHWRLQELCTRDAYVDQGFDFFVQALLTEKGWSHYRTLASRAAPAPGGTEPGRFQGPVRGDRSQAEDTGGDRRIDP